MIRRSFRLRTAKNSTSRNAGHWRHSSGRFFEQLEERTLLSITPLADYDTVSSVWFDSGSDYAPAAAVPLDFVGPLTLAQCKLRSAALSGLGVAELSQSQWIVRLTPEATALVSQVGDAETLLNTSTADFRVVRGLGLPGQVLVEAPGVAIPQAELALRTNPLVAYFSTNGSVSAQNLEIPDDPDFSQLWGLHNTGQTGGTADADIDAPEAWNFYMNSGFSSGPSGTVGSPHVVVAVIDSGLDYTHPDLYKNVWINQGEIPASLKSLLVDTDSDGLITFYDLNDPANAAHVVDSNATGYIDAADLLADPNWANGVDEDGDLHVDEGIDRYTDDLVGWNFSGTGIGNQPLDGSRHGTHVAGTIAAMGDNQTGTSGVAWRASIMPLKFLDDSNRGTTAEAMLAINYATLMRETYGVNVVVANNSWGYRGSSDAGLRDTIQASGQAGILFVAASGNGDILGHGVDNDEDPDHAFYPASEDLDNVLSVAASDDDDRLARFSNFGAASVDIAAPGVSILSTEPNVDPGSDEEDYRSRYGTSMAAPHVSGTAALVWSTVPDATAAEVKEAILLGGDPLPGPQDQAKLLSGKRLNAYGSLLVDTATPRATLVNAPNVDGPGVTETVITVHYRDNRLVNRASVLASQLLIADVADPSTTYHAVFQSVDVTEDSPTCTATYLLSAPGGVWETFHNGDYEVSLESGQVADSSSNWAPATPLGTFNVDTTPGLIRVTSFDDGTGPGTLRAAVIEANADTETENVIRLAPGTYTLTIAGRGEDAAATGDLDISRSVTIRGAGADVTTIDASGLDRIFHILTGVTADLQDVTLTAGDPQASGGGILNDGTLTLTRCQISASTATTGGGALANVLGATATIDSSTLFGEPAAEPPIPGNSAASGGAIHNQGTLTIVNSTISGNNATAEGGGIYNQSGTATIANATIANNTAATGGGINNLSTATLLNTIVADNAATTDPDFAGTVTSSGTNLIGSEGTSTGWIGSDLLDIDPLLSPLQDNTGTTLTHALLVGSPAIDTGTNTGAPAQDQRGIARPVDGDRDDVDSTDIGAVERYFGEIHGVLFHDVNPNGIRESREPGLPGSMVYLDSNQNERFDSGEQLTMTTEDNPVTIDINESGNYSFFNVKPEIHRVAPVIPVGWDESFREPRPTTERVSNGWEVIQAQVSGTSCNPSISANGRYVAFCSFSPDLVPEDTNGCRDIFVYDRNTRAIERVSVASDGTPADNESYSVRISADGRHVAFTSLASNLVTDDTNGVVDVFVHDRQTGITERVNIASDGTQANQATYDFSISNDGRYVAFESYASNLVGGDTNSNADVFVYDRQMGMTKRVSVTSDGVQCQYGGSMPSISGDGRYVAFHSYAWDLVVGDTNSESDVFVHDQLTDTTERVSVTSNGTEADGDSYYASISANGRYVAFASAATNLVMGDTNSARDVFLHDREAGYTERVSVTSDGTEANGISLDGYQTIPSISADGRYIAFHSDASNLVANDTNSVRDVFVHDRQAGNTELVSIASDGTESSDYSDYVSISDDGRYVTFVSDASNLVAGDTNDYRDVFVHDRQMEKTERASVASAAAQGDLWSRNASISADGRYVAFMSWASNLVAGETQSPDIFVHDRQTGLTELVSIASDGTQANGSSDYPSISADGRYVAFQSYASNLVVGDTNGKRDVFVHDRQTGTTERVSVASDGNQADDVSNKASISGDGRYVAFSSAASNLVVDDTNSASDIFVHDCQSGTTERVSVASDGAQADADSDYYAEYTPSVSGDGRYVAFNSKASNLVAGDTNDCWDVFVHDRQTGITERVSIAPGGFQANNDSKSPSITADGRYVAFTSRATNLTTDGGRWGDIFVRDRQTGTVECVSLASDGEQADNFCYDPSISADGRYVAFCSEAKNLASGEADNDMDVFVHDRNAGTLVRASVASDGTQTVDDSSGSISSDGRYIVLSSYAATLVPGDTNDFCDVFVTANLPAWQAATVVSDVGVGESIVGMESALSPLPGGIAGQVFRDLNRDGTQDPDELGQSEWTVFLDLDENGTLDEGEPSAITGSFGGYTFAGLDAFRTYAVAVVGKDYWIETLPSQTDGGTWSVQIGAGRLADDIDFGFYYAGPDAQSSDVVTGLLYRDLNVNGLQDPGEPGLAGWTIELNSDDGQISETTITNAGGEYEFTGVTARNYTVQAQAQTGWTLTTPLENSLSATPFGQGQFDQTQAVVTGDFDDDGDLDIAVTHGEYVSLLRNLGSGAFEPWQEISVGAGAYALVAGDFNHDGKLDLAVANFYAGTLAVLLNQNNPVAPFGSPLTTPVGSLPRSISAGQFNDDNHDGKIDAGDHLDIAIAHENGNNDIYVNDNQVSILRGNGDGSFQPPVYIAAGDSPVAIISGQFNDDNHDGWINDRDAVDLAVANLDSNDVTVLFNNGSGSFSTGVPVPVGDSTAGMPISLTAADLDRDGDLDLAVADLASDSVSILVNLGNGSFVGLPQILNAGTGPQAVIAADLEGDGDMDLIVTNNTAEHLGILRNFTDPATRVITFAPLESFGVANFDGGPSYSVVADHFDTDGTLDLAVAIGETSQRIASEESDAPQNYVSVLLNNVFEGAHHITVTGIEPIPELNFGVRPDGNLPSVVDRHVFYNTSWFDSNDPAANAGDDNAVATDKQALLPGQLATFANYTSYARGINGVMIDVAAPAGTATIDDFSFKVGNSSDLSTWTPLSGPDLPAVTVRAGAGTSGSDRITLVWPDNAVEQQWLQVTVLAGGNLGLVEDDVFYFGNAIGDSGEGNPAGVATAFISDELGARNHPHNFLNRAPVDDAYDYDRDSIVFISDELIARNHQTNFLTGLKLITAPAGAGTASPATAGTLAERGLSSDRSAAEPAEYDRYVDATMEESDSFWLAYAWFEELERGKSTGKEGDGDKEEAEFLVDLLVTFPDDRQ